MDKVQSNELQRRFCGCCGTEKDVSEFYKDGTDKDGNTRYRRDCKKCYADTRRTERANKDKKRRAAVKKEEKQRLKELDKMFRRR